jgi:hypothetical protein
MLVEGRDPDPGETTEETRAKRIGDEPTNLTFNGSAVTDVVARKS